MSRLIPGLSAVILLAVVALPARACINDREVVRSEREFKSQYLQSAPATRPAPEPLSPQERAVPFAFFGTGGILFLGAVAVVLSPRRRPDPEQTHS